LVQTILTLVLGPLGDRFSRKHLILGTDLVRGFLMATLAVLALDGWL
jgi:hypothetical protein